MYLQFPIQINYVHTFNIIAILTNYAPECMYICMSHNPGCSLVGVVLYSWNYLCVYACMYECTFIVLFVYVHVILCHACSSVHVHLFARYSFIHLLLDPISRFSYSDII